jgi:hypothetical protein
MNKSFNLGICNTLFSRIPALIFTSTLVVSVRLRARLPLLIHLEMNRPRERRNHYALYLYIIRLLLGILLTIGTPQEGIP